MSYTGSERGMCTRMSECVYEQCVKGMYVQSVCKCMCVQRVCKRGLKGCLYEQCVKGVHTISMLMESIQYTNIV